MKPVSNRVGPVKRFLGRTLLAWGRWRTEPPPPATDRCVLVCSPHTSNWDFFWFVAIMWSYGMEPHWIGKASLFRPPLGTLARKLGGVPVDRSGGRNQVTGAAQALKDARHMFLAIAPDGSRSKKAHWRTGFYHIASQAGVPLVLGYLDYPQRRGGFGGVLVPSGDLAADMERLRAFYAPIGGKFPDQTSDVRLAEVAGHG